MLVDMTTIDYVERCFWELFR